jgi:hypothetical protein
MRWLIAIMALFTLGAADTVQRVAIVFRADDTSVSPSDPGCVRRTSKDPIAAQAVCDGWGDTNIAKYIYHIDSSKMNSARALECVKNRGTVAAGESFTVSVSEFDGSSWANIDDLELTFDGDVSGKNAPGDALSISGAFGTGLAAEAIGLQFHTVTSGSTPDWDFTCTVTLEVRE